MALTSPELSGTKVVSIPQYDLSEGHDQYLSSVYFVMASSEQNSYFGQSTPSEQQYPDMPSRDGQKFRLLDRHLKIQSRPLSYS